MRVVNVRNLPPNSPGILYCGRESKGWQRGLLANDHWMGYTCKTCKVIHSRVDCVRAFREDLWKWIKDDWSSWGGMVRDFLLSLPEDAVLGCWCSPQLCHCEVIIKASLWLKAQPKG